MKLTWRIVLRISLLLSVLLGIWAIYFYHRIIAEVNDETDDSLELMSENLIEMILRGKELPSENNGTNNTYYIDSLSYNEAVNEPSVIYLNENVYIRQKDDTEPSRVLKTVFVDRKGQYYRLTVAIPTVDKEDLIEAITDLIIILYIALLIVIFSTCSWVLWRTMKPLYGLLKWLDNYSISNNITPYKMNSRITEFKKLNDGIMRSAERNEQLYRQQKQFIGNASHEIQTPLAICQNRLELLAETPLNEDQYSEVSKMLKTVSYISKLNRELLLISKIDADQYLEKENINIKEDIDNTIEDSEIIFANKRITITKDIDNDSIISANPTLVSILITNLIKNAYVHNIEGGSINIVFRDKKLIISNTGVNHSLNTDQIFDRFYQGSKKEGSTGLGLSLVKAISDKNDYNIRYYFKDNMHYFELCFNKIKKSKNF